MFLLHEYSFDAILKNEILCSNGILGGAIMAKLENITIGSTVKGIVGNEPVSVAAGRNEV